jgi:hypothetical protein
MFLLQNRSARRPWRANTRAPWSPLLLLPGFLLVNAALTVHLWLGVGSGVRAVIPVVESVLIFVLVGLAGAVGTARGRRLRPGRSPGRLPGGSLPVFLNAAAVLILAGGLIFSAAEALVRIIWGRPFAFRTDLPMIRSVLLLFLGDIGAVVNVLVPMVIVLIGGAVIALAALLVVLIARAMPPVAAARSALSILPVLILALAVPPATGYERGTISPMVARGISDSGRLELRDLSVPENGLSQVVPSQEVPQPDTIPDAIPEDDPGRYAFPGLRDRDIHFFMIEAYGYAAFSRDRLREELAPYLERLAAVLEEAGYGVVSDYLAAPVYGGFSWLSETTVLTGQPVDSQPKFAELLDISRERAVPSLSRMLHEGGYYTVSVKPGTVHGSWPEGWDLFRFERSLVAHDGDFNYRGPWFSYVAVTDQHALWTTHHHLLEATGPGGVAEGRPVYVHYQLVSSHTPFNKVPPYIERWEDLGDGTIYHERADETLTFNNTWGGGTELDEGYVASIAYVLHTLTEYIGQLLVHQQRPILVIMGDHQPQRPIRENDAGPSVPVHIAAQDQEFLRALRSEGFEEGLRGAQPPPHAPMMDFFPMLRRIARGSSAGSLDAD